MRISDLFTHIDISFITLKSINLKRERNYKLWESFKHFMRTFANIYSVITNNHEGLIFTKIN